VRAHVLPHVEELAHEEREKTSKDTGQNQNWLKSWWQLFRSRKELIDRISKLQRYMVCSELTKRPIFSFVHPQIRPDHTLEAFVFEDDYSFGVLQSGIHWSWFIATCSKLKGDFRYTPESVFDTLAWPQKPTRQQIKAVAEAAVALRALRSETMRKLNYSLRDLTARSNSRATIHCAMRTRGSTLPCVLPTGCRKISIHSLSCSNSISPAPRKKKPSRKSRRRGYRYRPTSTQSLSQATASNCRFSRGDRIARFTLQKSRRIS